MRGPAGRPRDNGAVRLRFRTAAVGSTNPAKVQAVTLALARLAPECRVEGVEAPVGSTVQPFGDDETRRGAELRARSALALAKADVAFGLEGGVVLDGDRVWLLSWVAAVSKEAQVGYASGLRMPLPPKIAPRLVAGEELGVIVDELFGLHESKRQAGAIGLLTDGFVSRTDAFADLVAMACAPFLHPDLYERP